jgi:hypothetical protein
MARAAAQRQARGQKTQKCVVQYLILDCSRVALQRYRAFFIISTTALSEFFEVFISTVYVDTQDFGQSPGKDAHFFSNTQRNHLAGSHTHSPLALHPVNDTLERGSDGARQLLCGGCSARGKSAVG